MKRFPSPLGDASPLSGFTPLISSVLS